MGDEENVYEEIARLLIEAAPQDASSLSYTFIVDAESNAEEGAVYTYEFDYIDKDGELKWFGEECFGLIDSLTLLSLQLRSIIESRSKSKSKRMKFDVDMGKESFKADFSYDSEA